MFISTVTRMPIFPAALSSVPNPNREVRDRRKSENKKQVRQSPFSADCLTCFYVYSTSFRRFFKKPSLPHWTIEESITKFEDSYPQISAFYCMHASEKMVPYQREPFSFIGLRPHPLLTFVIGTKYTIKKRPIHKKSTK